MMTHLMRCHAVVVVVIADIRDYTSAIDVTHIKHLTRCCRSIFHHQPHSHTQPQSHKAVDSMLQEHFSSSAMHSRITPYIIHSSTCSRRKKNSSVTTICGAHNNYTEGHEKKKQRHVRKHVSKGQFGTFPEEEASAALAFDQSAICANT